jgi:putative oxidoreductase
MSAIRTLEPYARSLLRIVAGFTFCSHGMQKILGTFGGLNGGTAPHWSLIWVAGMLELVGGLLIIVGLFTSPVSFVLCGEMAVAYFRVHAPHSFFPLVNRGETAVLYCFVFLYLCVAGAGTISLDAVLRKKPN